MFISENLASIEMSLTADVSYTYRLELTQYFTLWSDVSSPACRDKDIHDDEKEGKLLYMAVALQSAPRVGT